MQNADGLVPKSSDGTSDSAAPNCDASSSSSPSPAPPSSSGPPSAEEVAKAVQQRGFRLAELLETEKTYVEDLRQCVDYIGHMRESKEQEEPEIPIPEDLKNGKDRMVFGNIEAIFEWHRE